MSKNISTPRSASKKTIAKEYITKVNLVKVTELFIDIFDKLHASNIDNDEINELEEKFLKMNLNKEKLIEAYNLIESSSKTKKESKKDGEFFIDQEYLANFEWILDEPVNKKYLDIQQTFTELKLKNLATKLYKNYYESDEIIEKGKYILYDELDPDGHFDLELNTETFSDSLQKYVFTQTNLGKKDTNVKITINDLIIKKLKRNA